MPSEESGYYDAEEHTIGGETVFFYKAHKGDKVWWLDYQDRIGDLAITLDKKKIYNLWADYPDKLTAEEKALFDKENPYWADFFGGR